MVPSRLDQLSTIRFADFVVDLERRGLYRGTERIHLTPTPFRTLAFLAQHSGQVVSKEQLLLAVWGGQRDENTVEQAIRQIRRALGDDIDQPRFIHTIPAEGYCFIAPVQQELEVSPATVPSPAGPAPKPAVATRRLGRFAVLVFLLAAIAILLAALANRHDAPGLAASNPTRTTRSQAHILSPLMMSGAMLFYPRYQNGSYSLATVSTSGGVSLPVSTPVANPELCDVAPGGAILLRDLVRTRDEDNPLYIQPVHGTPYRVGQLLVYDAAWTPDKQHILFSTGGTVYSTDVNGSAPHLLFNVPGNAFWFRWSPDGKLLRFTVIDQKSEATSLWEVAADGNNPRRLFADLGLHLCCGSWMPGGRFFVFQARVENLFQIWAHREGHGPLPTFGSQPFPLISGAISYRSPVFSGDGSRVFVRAEDLKGELIQYNTQSHALVPLLPSLSARMIAFSPDGQWIAAASLADNNLWRCRADGSDCLQLTHDLKNVAMPVWAPDGHSILFMGLGFQGEWTVYSASSSGGPILPITHDSQAKGFPTWSPDGQSLAFSDVPPVSQPAAIYVLNLRTRQTASLPGSAGYFFPRWSPDGRTLVALHAPDQHLFLFNVATGEWRQIASLPSGYPNWSHDGRFVYFLSNSDNQRNVFRVSISSGAIEKIAGLASVERGPFVMGDWIGLTPDDSPIAVRNMTTEDIYAWDLAAR